MRADLRPIPSRRTDVRFVARLATATVGAAVARFTYRAVDAWDREREGRLLRTNHRGAPVTLAQGPATVLGSAASLTVAPGIPSNVRAAGVLGSLACGGFGLYDDVAGSGSAKGLKGHFTALRNGEVTSGALKVIGIGATALIVGPLARGGRGGWVDAGLSAVLVAATANALNLFDLRPGRAVKVFLGPGVGSLLAPGPAGDMLSGPVGAAAGLLTEDLNEQSMLGDTGANVLGALLGTAAAASLSRKGLLAAVSVATALTIVSERVSYSQVIESTPALRNLDEWGRRSG